MHNIWSIYISDMASTNQNQPTTFTIAVLHSCFEFVSGNIMKVMNILNP